MLMGCEVAVGDTTSAAHPDTITVKQTIPRIGKIMRRIISIAVIIYEIVFITRVVKN